jgi:solute carrier family 25 carnitine/acylcarnitine transporter 20/29
MVNRAGFLAMTKRIYKQRGIAGFYKGFTPCFLRCLPANGAVFVGYEHAMGYLNRVH